MNYTPPPKAPVVFNQQLQNSLANALGDDYLQERVKLRQVIQKQQGYDKPKPKRNEGMNTSQGGVLL